MKQFWNWLKKEWWQIAVLFIVAAPVATYVRLFGWQISTDHDAWVATSSAMAGIYGPIVAFLAFIALLRQVRLMRQATELQFTTTKHMLQQAFIQDARTDIQFYLTELSNLLDKPAERGLVPRFVLQLKFKEVSIEQLRGEELRGFSDALDACCPQLKTIWIAFYTLVNALGGTNEHPYDVNHVVALQKALAMLSNDTCISLDNFVYSATKDSLGIRFCFSSVVTRVGADAS